MDAGSIDTLSKTVLGALLLLSVGINGYLFRLLIKEKDDRREEEKQRNERLTKAFEDRTEVDKLFLEKIEAGKRGRR